MGSSSKVILVGATSLIVGVYAISLKKAQADGVETAMKHMNRVQLERAEDAAMRTALASFVKAGGTRAKKGTMKGLAGSTFTYSITPGANTAVMTITTVKNGKKSSIRSRLDKDVDGHMEHGPRKIHRGQWAVTKVFTSHSK